MLASLGSHLFSHPATLKSYLLRLVLAAVLPLLIFSTSMIVFIAQQERSTFQRGLVETTRALTLNVDRLLQSSINNLESMASSPRLDAGDIIGFCNRADRMLQSYDEWKMIILLDPVGNQLCTTIGKDRALAPGVVEREALETVLRTRKPALSNLFADKNLGASVGAFLPVVRGQKVAFILVAVLPAKGFADILAQQKLASDWVGVVADRKKMIVARTPPDEQIGGQLAALLTRGATEQSTHGWIENVLRSDGVRSYLAYSRSLWSGWSVAVDVPALEVDDLYYRSLLTVGGVGTIFMLVALVLALIFARKISAPVRSLTLVAEALGGEQKISKPAASGIAEVDALTKDMMRTAELLEKRSHERNKVESELLEKEEFLQRQADLLDLSGEAIIGWELGGAVTYWNRGAEKLYSVPRRDAVGHSSHDLLSWLFPNIELDLGAMLNDHGEWSGEVKHLTRDGRTLVVERSVRLVQERSGHRLVLESNRDITGRKQFIQRITTEHAITLILSETNDLADAVGRILETIGAGLNWEVGFFWKVRDDGWKIECLKSWHGPSRKLSDCEVKPPLARGVGLAGRVWASKQPLWIADMDQQADSFGIFDAKAENLHSAFGFPIKQRGEVLGVVEFMSSDIREPGEDLLKMVETIGSEISQFIERLRAEAALRHSEENLRNQAQELERQLLASGRLVAVGELTASMTHEFNNPLGIIIGFAQSILADMDPSDANYHHVEIIVEEAQRCEKIVQELLEFGRPKNAEFALTDVKAVIEKTLDLVSSRAAKNNVGTTMQTTDQLPSIHADVQQLQQVLLNLCLNAVDAMPRGGELTVGAEVNAAGELTITVRDTGYGIDADALPRIFQPFFTAKKRRGLGLGLPICDRIIKTHGGKITVESQAGQGATFRIHLPIKGTIEKAVDAENSQASSAQKPVIC